MREIVFGIKVPEIRVTADPCGYFISVGKLKFLCTQSDQTSRKCVCDPKSITGMNHPGVQVPPRCAG